MGVGLSIEVGVITSLNGEESIVERNVEIRSTCPLIWSTSMAGITRK